MLKNFSTIRVLTLAVTAATLLGVLGCNTVEGAGKDTEKAGEKIQDAADRNK